MSDVEYRHINVSRKRLSELSYSIRGNNLRNKRRRLNDGEQVVFNSLDVNPLTDINLSANPSKLEVLDFFGVRQGDKLSLDQGEIIMDLRLEQINFVKSSSMPNSPRDGNCLISCIVDQVNHDHIMSGFIDNENCRQKIVHYGYNMMKTGRLVHSGDPQQFSNPEGWRDNMKQDGVFGDQIFLQSTANVLSSNIYIFSAIKDSSIDRLNGYSKIEPIVPAMNEDIYLFLFNESDFKTPHYESIFKKVSKCLLL